MRAVVFANGTLREPQIVRERMRSSDLKIAADGGTRHFTVLGFKPDVIIGDFDSLPADLMSEMLSAEVEIIRHPARKDFTDLELALRYAVERGADTIDVFAAIGNRLDQSLANLLMLASPRFQDVNLRLFEGRQEIQVVRGGNQCELHGLPGETVSLIPLKDDAHGITTRGLEYPLTGETLRFGETRGISNVLLEPTAFVRLEEGLLLIDLLHAEEPDEA